MNILVLHRIPYHKVNYHLGIDHQRHQVSYIGTSAALDNIPFWLPCQRLVRPGLGRVSDEVLQCLGPRPPRFDLVLSLSEYELLDAARVREALGVPGEDEATVLLVRDKLRMKQKVAAAGLAVPRAMALSDWQAGTPLPWLGRTILKPVDGASSEGVLLFDDVEALSQHLAQHGRPAGEQVLEAFIEGPILHFDGLVLGGEVALLQASQYLGTCFGYAQGQPLGSVQRPLRPQEAEWVQAVIEALGLRTGAFHLEAFADPAGPVFLEIGHRVGGAEVAETFRLRSGIDLHQAWLGWLTAGQVPPAVARSADYYGWFVLPGHHLPAGHCRLQGHQGFVDHPQVVRWQQLAPGQALPRHITYQAHEVPAAGILRGRDPAALQALMQQILTTVQVDVLPEVLS